MARTKHDDKHPGDGQRRTRNVPRIGTHAIREPEPQQGGRNVDPAIRRIGPTRRDRMKRKQPDEEGETRRRRKKNHEWRSILEPKIRQVAANDLGDRGHTEKEQGHHRMHRHSVHFLISMCLIKPSRNDPSGLIGSEASRFDTGIDQTPLSGPVVAHGAVAVDVPAFHPVQPVHLGMHCRQRPVDVARIEGVVRVREKVAVHRPHTHDTGIIVARRTGPQRVAGPIHATIEFRSVGNPARAVWSNLMDRRTSDDSHLVDRLRRGDARAFDELVTAYQHRVFSVALRMLRNRTEAEEVAQEVFLRVYRTVAAFRGDAKLSTWLYAIASRVCLNRLASSDRRVTREGDETLTRLASGDATPVDELERSELEATLHRAIAELPEERRIVVVLRDLEGLSYEEIAAALDLELGTVRSRLHRARMDLKEKLERFLP